VAFTKSGIYVHTVQEMFRATATTPAAALDFRLGTHKIALHSAARDRGHRPDQLLGYNGRVGEHR
jgi:hypothetical protein